MSLPSDSHPKSTLTGRRHTAEGGGGGERGLAACQHGGLEVRVTTGVLDQVVTPHEALVAQGAQEALLSRVSASVAGELVGAGELLLAVRPGAGEGSLPCRTEAFYYHHNHPKNEIIHKLCIFLQK